MDKKKKTTNQEELVETYRFLLMQSRDLIINTWLKEAIERQKAISFIRSEGLHAEFARMQQPR